MKMSVFTQMFVCNFSTRKCLINFTFYCKVPSYTTIEYQLQFYNRWSIVVYDGTVQQNLLYMHNGMASFKFKMFNNLYFVYYRNMLLHYYCISTVVMPSLTIFTINIFLCNWFYLKMAYMGRDMKQECYEITFI